MWCARPARRTATPPPASLPPKRGGELADHALGLPGHARAPAAGSVGGYGGNLTLDGQGYGQYPDSYLERSLGC